MTGANMVRASFSYKWCGLFPGSTGSIRSAPRDNALETISAPSR
jgi:hypothetical protein